MGCFHTHIELLLLCDDRTCLSVIFVLATVIKTVNIIYKVFFSALFTWLGSIYKCLLLYARNLIFYIFLSFRSFLIFSILYFLHSRCCRDCSLQFIVSAAFSNTILPYMHGVWKLHQVCLNLHLVIYLTVSIRSKVYIKL